MTVFKRRLYVILNGSNQCDSEVSWVIESSNQSGEWDASLPLYQLCNIVLNKHLLQAENDEISISYALNSWT